MLILEAPVPGQTLGTSVSISGKIRGTWFNEGTFPLKLVNSDGVTVADGVARADSEWTTEDFVPFSATLSFIYPEGAKRGAGKLVLMKDNHFQEGQKDCLS